MNFIDLESQDARIEAGANERIRSVVAHSQCVMGPEVGELEARPADYVGVEHCMGVSSGTDALLDAMMVLAMRPGDEVITTPCTFVATAKGIARLGAIPHLIDIDRCNCNIDPNLVEAAIGPTTRAIMPVSLYGSCVDMDAVNAIAARHGLSVIEDPAQSSRATDKGRRFRSLSTIGCTSYFPPKPLGCDGDDGALVTNGDSVVTTLRQIMNHGQDRRATAMPGSASTAGRTRFRALRRWRSLRASRVRLSPGGKSAPIAAPQWSGAVLALSEMPRPDDWCLTWRRATRHSSPSKRYRWTRKTCCSASCTRNAFPLQCTTRFR